MSIIGSIVCGSNWNRSIGSEPNGTEIQRTLKSSIFSKNVGRSIEEMRINES
jgi:hypothetical protein